MLGCKKQLPARLFFQNKNVERTLHDNDFSGLVYGDLPDQQEILATLMQIRERLTAVEWIVRVGR